MKNTMKKMLTWLSIGLLVTTTFPLYSFADTTESEETVTNMVSDPIPDGNYTINFQLLNETSGNPSSLGSYVGNTATVLVKNGTYNITMNVPTDKEESVSSMNVRFWTYDANGTKVQATQVDNPNIVQFVTPSLSEETILNVTYSAGQYTGDHNTRLVFDRQTLTSVDSETDEDTHPTPDPTPISDGTYQIQFQLLNATSDKVSSLAKYLVSPATVKVANGRYTVTMKVPEDQTDSVAQMNVRFATYDENGTKVQANLEDDPNTLTFDVASLNETTLFNVTYSAGNYSGNHDTRLVFDTTTLTPIEDSNTGGGGEETETPDESGDEKSYDIDYKTVAENSDKDSSAGNYLEPTAHVVEKAGKYVVTFTLKPDQIQSAKNYNLSFWGFQADGSKYEATTADKTKAVYTVDSLDTPLLANVTYSVPNVIDGDHNFRFIFTPNQSEEGVSSLTDSKTGVKITTTEQNKLPAGTTLSVSTVTNGDVYEKVGTIINNSFTLYQIKLLDKDQNEIQPNNEINIHLPVASSATKDSVYAYNYIEYTKQVVPFTSTVADGYCVFTTNHLSYYGVANYSILKPNLANTKNTTGTTSTSVSNPQTFDTTQKALYLTSFIFSGLGLLYLGYRKYFPY